MDDLVRVQILHASGDLLGPVDQTLRRDLLSILEQVVQWPVWTELHDNAVAGRLCAHSPIHK